MLIALLACGGSGLAPRDCSATSVDDDDWSAISLAELRTILHEEDTPRDLDWNLANPVDAAAARVSFDPVAFTGDAELCVSGIEHPTLSQLTAPVTVELTGDAWISDQEVEGELVIAGSGATALHLVTTVALPAALDAATAELITAATGAEVATADAPGIAWLDVWTYARAGGVLADLYLDPGQTVIFADEADPEPMGVEVTLARTDH
jgi:hypothetical protein